MLDGLLGRSGFFSKCKSLIKQTRTRIDVVKRKRNATQKFLRKDVADLLANGLETNACGRAEGLVMELIVSSCYDFIDHVCEIILKHLPVLQKLRDCPDDCKEAVASLMYAAARFSDLPELRELRDLFQERYGCFLEHYVNQKLVENITPKPPSMEKKIQLMREIATEFSIWWDSRGFGERLSNSPTNEKNKRPSPVTLHPVEIEVVVTSAEETVHKTVKDEVLAKKSEATSRTKERVAVDRHQTEMRRCDPLGRRDDLKHNVSRGSEIVNDRYKPSSYKEETTRKREEHAISYQRRGSRPEADALPVRKGVKSITTVDHELAEGIQSRAMGKRDDVADGLKSNFRSAIPPPYVKSRKYKHKTDDQQEDTLTFNPGSNSNKSENRPENEDEQVRFTEIYYKDASSCEMTPRRRSHRRKHSRSTSSKDGVNGEMGPDEERVVRRVSTSRRKHESRKGLQILFDDDQYKKNKEEKMIDKLLLHYSKKPSGDPGKPKRKTTNTEMNGTSKSSHQKAVEDENQDSTPSTSRSFSLPSRHVTKAEPQKKVFTRAVSFQQETPAKHVHPKLPDYDDLAARFAALRASRD